MLYKICVDVQLFTLSKGKASKIFYIIFDLLTAHRMKFPDMNGEARNVDLDILTDFDRLWYDGLLHKLKSCGVSSQVLELIRSFFYQIVKASYSE